MIESFESKLKDLHFLADTTKLNEGTYFETPLATFCITGLFFCHVWTDDICLQQKNSRYIHEPVVSYQGIAKQQENQLF